MEFLNSSNLQKLNQVNEPTFYSGGYSEDIDITVWALGASIKYYRLGGLITFFLVGPLTYSVHFTGLLTGTPC